MFELGCMYPADSHRFLTDELLFIDYLEPVTLLQAEEVYGPRINL